MRIDLQCKVLESIAVVDRVRVVGLSHVKDIDNFP